MPILVLALNPSIDLEWRVRELQWEEKNVIESERRWAGGKGINVARWLTHLRAQARLLVPVGGAAGRELARYLKKETLSATVTRVQQDTRVNVIVTTANGRQMRFNPKGPKLSRREWDMIFARLNKALSSASVLILSGSLPRDAQSDVYRRMIHSAHAAGCKTLLDCDGAPFAAGVGAKPFLVKPNEHELAQWFGKELRSSRDAIAAAHRLSAATSGWVLVSRGRKGALLINASEQRAWHCEPPAVRAVNTVGAGDAMMAAIANQIENGAPPVEWLRWGVATGSVATQVAAGHLPKLHLIRNLANELSLRPATGSHLDLWQ